jgi:hypothetical protein
MIINLLQLAHEMRQASLATSTDYGIVGTPEIGDQNAINGVFEKLRQGRLNPVIGQPSSRLPQRRRNTTTIRFNPTVATRFHRHGALLPVLTDLGPDSV